MFNSMVCEILIQKTFHVCLRSSDATQELELDKFITHEVAFKDINTAFDLLLQGKSLRCTIWMDK